MDNIIMKKITLILVVMFSLLSFTSDHVRVNPTQYDMRLTFIQDRSRMLEEMFEKQYEEGTLTGDYAFFYVKMVQSLDSCAADLKHFKVLFK
tara:strand:+ start:243 stop:518 length:276 start_codon:yes stop_codon:yes gene_type:complete